PVIWLSLERHCSPNTTARVRYPAETVGLSGTYEKKRKDSPEIGTVSDHAGVNKWRGVYDRGIEGDSQPIGARCHVLRNGHGGLRSKTSSRCRSRRRLLRRP